MVRVNGVRLFSLALMATVTLDPWDWAPAVVGPARTAAPRARAPRRRNLLFMAAALLVEWIDSSFRPGVARPLHGPCNAAVARPVQSGAGRDGPAQPAFRHEPVPQL